MRLIKKIIIRLILLGIALGLICGGYLCYQILTPMSAQSVEKKITIGKGLNIEEISKSLKENGLIRSQRGFVLIAKYSGLEQRIHAGDYTLNQNMNSVQIAIELAKNNVSKKERTIQIIEGWTADNIGSYLELQGQFPKEDFIKQIDKDYSGSYQFLKDKPADANLDGYLFPDTYRVFDNANPDEVVRKMLDNFDRKYTYEMRDETIKIKMDIFSVVTLASVVEKEVATDQDRPIVAGIFYKRLNNNMRLQSDATVNYVTGKKELQPESADLDIESPYNTYKNKGLPPGPICNPGLAAIKAVIYPEKTDYLYFLTTKDGTVVYAKTYNDHLQNKKKYLD